MTEAHHSSGVSLPHSATLGTRQMVELDPEAEARYGAYRRRQARALVSMLPQEAVRPLYAQARAWARDAGLEATKDPLATLQLFLQQLLPLPPFAVWLRDRANHLEEHVREEFDSPQAYRRPSSPVTVESRSVDLEGDRWSAALHVFRRDEAWRGFISFHGLEDDRRVRTGEIFQEDDPIELRNRFLSYQPHTLQAFLRSVLP